MGPPELEGRSLEDATGEGVQGREIKMCSQTEQALGLVPSRAGGGALLRVGGRPWWCVFQAEALALLQRTGVWGQGHREREEGAAPHK